MKLIITGATGSLGSSLVRYFAAQGHEITASGRSEYPPQKLLDIADYIRADITQKLKFPKADACIHAAALSDDKAKYADLYKANVIGTKQVLKASKSCSKFIYVSSSSVYIPSDKLLSEFDAGDRNGLKLSAYGKSKLEAEALIRKANIRTDAFILRPRALYGIGDKMILPRMFKLIKNGKMQVPGGLKARASMTHYQNFNRAVELCLQSGKSGINTYNVSDNESYTLLDAMRKFTQALYGKQLPEKQIPVFVLRFLSVFKIGGITPLLVRALTQDMVLDIDKIKSELNYMPTYNIDNSLSEIQKWVEYIGGTEVLITGKKELAWDIE